MLVSTVPVVNTAMIAVSVELTNIESTPLLTFAPVQSTPSVYVTAVEAPVRLVPKILILCPAR